jgi:hypothetical protein
MLRKRAEEVDVVRPTRVTSRSIHVPRARLGPHAGNLPMASLFSQTLYVSVAELRV